MNTPSKLDKAKVAIGLDHPFFAHILYKRKLVETKDVPTLAVSDRGTIYYNPDFIESLPVSQIVWGLAHEVGHVVTQCATRRGNRDHKRWNIADDAWINDTLDHCKVGERIPNCIDMKGSKDTTTEKIYDSLPEGVEDQFGSGDGMGEDIIIEGGVPMTEAEAKEYEAQIKVEMAEAMQVAKVRGNLPGKLAEFVAQTINVKTPWYEILERYMTDQTRAEYSWARPNRRFADYMPSTGKVPTMGELVVQVDISGSVSHREIEYYNGHLKRIIEQCTPERVHVIYTDTRVQHHDTFDRGEEVNINFHSGGGTDMRAGFDYIDEQGIEPAVMVTLTDGYTPFPESVPFNAVWCISSKEQAPDCAGQTIHFEMEH